MQLPAGGAQARPEVQLLAGDEAGAPAADALQGRDAGERDSADRVDLAGGQVPVRIDQADQQRFVGAALAQTPNDDRRLRILVQKARRPREPVRSENAVAVHELCTYCRAPCFCCRYSSPLWRPASGGIWPVMQAEHCDATRCGDVGAGVVGTGIDVDERAGERGQGIEARPQTRRLVAADHDYADVRRRGRAIALVAVFRPRLCSRHAGDRSSRVLSGGGRPTAEQPRVPHEIGEKNAADRRAESA